MKQIPLALLCLFAFGAFADTSRIDFSGGWIKQLPPVVPMRAGYLTIENRSARNHRISAIQSQSFDSVEVHESKLQDGVMKMVELDSIELPAGARVELKPGGKHLMLIGPEHNLQVGERVQVTITFDDGSAQRVQLEVRQ